MTFLYRQKLKAPNIKSNNEPGPAITRRGPKVLNKSAIGVVNCSNNPVMIMMPKEKKTVAVSSIKLILNPMIRIQNSMNLVFDFFNANIKIMSATITVNDQRGPTITPGDPIKGTRMPRRSKP